MKGFKHYLRAALAVLLPLFTAAANVQADNDSLQFAGGRLMSSVTLSEPPSVMLPRMDSVDISLITCGPGSAIYSLYGHTAIRITDRATGEDVIANWGIFDSSKSLFVLRFVFGLTDYQIALEPFNQFFLQYAATGRWMKQQLLNLTRKEKWSIICAIDRNNLPENRVYRYNYFYDNCTTRARDMIESHVDGKIEYAVNSSAKTSYRDMIHQWNEDSPWARFGNDMLLGVKADSRTDFRQQQFLPDSLRAYFDQAIVVSHSGEKRKLVENSILLFDPSVAQAMGYIAQPARKSFPLSPTGCALLLLGLTLAVSLIEWRRHRILWGYDLLLLTADSAAGIILLAMVFSQHPTVSLNLQILLCNPLTAVFLFPLIMRERKQKAHYYWKVFAVCLLLFFAGNIIQHYAEGMNIVAATLLLRCIMNLWLNASKENQP